jgi:hypothetical protein
MSTIYLKRSFSGVDVLVGIGEMRRKNHKDTIKQNKGRTRWCSYM